MTSIHTVLVSFLEVLPQAPSSGSDFRPYLYVLLAYGAAWLVIGAWIFKIARRVSRLSAIVGDIDDPAR